MEKINLFKYIHYYRYGMSSDPRHMGTVEGQESKLGPSSRKQASKRDVIKDVLELRCDMKLTDETGPHVILKTPKTPKREK